MISADLRGPVEGSIPSLPTMKTVKDYFVINGLGDPHPEATVYDSDQNSIRLYQCMRCFAVTLNPTLHVQWHEVENK